MNIGTGGLVLPVNRTAVLKMNAEDVSSTSFWVPGFRVKQDLGARVRRPLTCITPTEVSSYKLRCAEIPD